MLHPQPSNNVERSVIPKNAQTLYTILESRCQQDIYELHLEPHQRILYEEIKLYGF
jgi:hypothetical protein